MNLPTAVGRTPTGIVAVTRVGRRGDHRDGVFADSGDIDLAAVGGDRHAIRLAADRDWRPDHGVGRGIYHRDVVGGEIGDVDLAAVGGDRHAPRLDADGYWRPDHRVGRRIYHRDSVVTRVRNIGVLGARRRRGEQASFAVTWPRYDTPNENGGRPPLDLRGMLREFVDEFRQVRGEVEAEGRASTRAPAAARPCARTLMRSHAPVGRCRYLAAL